MSAKRPLSHVKSRGLALTDARRRQAAGKVSEQVREWSWRPGAGEYHTDCGATLCQDRPMRPEAPERCPRCGRKTAVTTDE